MKLPPIVERGRALHSEGNQGQLSSRVGAPPREFSRERLAKLGSIEQRHFWFVGRRALVDRLLRRHLRDVSAFVVDLGCGTGAMVAFLAGRGYQVLGIDLRPEGLQARGRDVPAATFAQGDITALPLGNGCCDAVTLFDVLEHADDAAVLGEVYRILRPGGLLLLTVPAFPWLWSYRDEAAGHRRRYARRALRELLKGAGFTVSSLRYYQFVLFPALLLSRLLGRKGSHMRDIEDTPLPLLNPLLAVLNRVEAVVGEIVRWPWGSSLVAVCRRARE